MARVHTVKKAQKSKFARLCATCRKEIVPGDSYRYADLKTGPTSGFTRYWCSGCTPRASQLTSNDRLSRLYAANESVSDVLAGAWEFASLAEALSSAADEAREVGEEYEESASNMEEYFQGSSQVDEIREKGEACTEWADALQEAANDIENLSEDECGQCGEKEEADAHNEDSEDFEHEFEIDRSEAESKAEEVLAALNL